MNKSNLANLLTIKDLQKESIFDVIGRMKVLLEFFKRNPKHKNLVPFLKTYYLITKSVAERSLEHKKYFRDVPKLHKLDVYFVDLYFRPLKAYLLKKTLLKPWQTYFRYCHKKDGIPFVQMLLGINAHINSDLLTSVVHLAYQERADFLRINQILKEEIPDVMKFLVKVDHDLYGLGVLIFKNFALREFKNVIVAWREIVWKNGKNIEKRNYPSIRKGIDIQTERIGSEIVRSFEEIENLGNAPKFISHINSLKVKLS